MKIRRVVLKLLSAISLLGLASNATAVTNYWVNSATGNWNEPTNWLSGAIPGASDDARINNGGTALIDDAQTVNTGFAVMADTNGTSGRLQMTGGRLVSNFDIRIGGNAATGGGNGVFDQSGGVVFMNGGNLNVGFGTTAIGTYNLSGGTLWFGDTAFVPPDLADDNIILPRHAFQRRNQIWVRAIQIGQIKNSYAAIVCALN